MRGVTAAADGFPLAVTRFAASGTPVASVVVAGAMGVRQDFYAPFARYLAANGMHVVTFDYRGMGYSRCGSLRDFDTDVSTWAERDTNAMLAAAQAMGPGLPLLYLGHSLGGQILGVLPDAARVRAALTIAAGSGYYKLNDRMPLQVRFLWFFLMPVLTSVFGYFPGRRLRVVGDLPGGVARQWRRWCLHPEYLLAEGERYRASFARVRIPLLGLSVDDDDLVTKPAIDHLHSFYCNAQVERRHYSPAALDVDRIGHFGFFSGSNRDTLWKEALAWLGDRRLHRSDHG